MGARECKRARGRALAAWCGLSGMACVAWLGACGGAWHGRRKERSRSWTAGGRKGLDHGCRPLVDRIERRVIVRERRIEVGVRVRPCTSAVRRRTTCVYGAESGRERESVAHDILGWCYRACLFNIYTLYVFIQLRRMWPWADIDGTLRLSAHTVAFCVAGPG